MFFLCCFASQSRLFVTQCRLRLGPITDYPALNFSRLSTHHLYVRYTPTGLSVISDTSFLFAHFCPQNSFRLDSVFSGIFPLLFVFFSISALLHSIFLYPLSLV